MNIIKNSARNFLSAATLLLLVKNWPQTLQAILLPQGKYPALRFRRGVTIEGLPDEAPFSWFGPVFRDRDYRRHITEPQAGTIIDIGANIGGATLDWLSCGDKLEVHAYEPDPRTFEVLNHNIRFNHYENRVRIYNEAVGRTPGTTEFYRSGCSTGTGAFLPAGHASQDRFVAQVVSLDQVVQRIDKDSLIALVKIDAEGAETEILEGASASTLRSIPQFVIECHDLLVPRAQARCVDVLERSGFRCIVRPTEPQLSLLYAVQV